MPQHRPPVWLHSDRFLARNLARPVQRFLHVEAAGGLVLLVAAAAALIWANSRWSASYYDLWATELVIEVGGHGIAESLQHWVNDALMAVFFFVVGLEIKRELVSGQLAERRDALLPALAAVGGMVVPAATYALINAGGPGSGGWGIPMATDIAFAVGVLALLGPRVPGPLKILLLALAIVDDIGAIVVIAVFYSDDLELAWAAAAVVGLVLIGLLRRARVWYLPVYSIVALAVWYATFQSGIHATIAGVALGLMTPARPLHGAPDAAAIAGELSADRDVTVDEVRAASFRLRESVSVAERLENLLHPWTSYLIVPLFALANAGVQLSGGAVADAASSRITIGVVVGLVVGKVVGVTGAVLLATRTRLATMPAGVTVPQIVGLGLLAGIGFTVSLFVTGLAFDAPALQDEAKIGVLAASAVAALTGAVVLRRTLPPVAAIADDASDS